jgi:SWIRM-associated domain at the N-terminal
MLFADTSLGRDVPFDERVQGVTKLPLRFFADFFRDGPLASILRACVEYKNAKGWDVIDLRDNERRYQHLEMIRVAERALRAAKFYPRIKVLFSATLPAEKETELCELVHLHGAAVVSSPDVASHVVYPDPPATQRAYRRSNAAARAESIGAPRRHARSRALVVPSRLL